MLKYKQGQVIDDRFSIMKEIASQGGMTTVYKAFDLQTEVTVALKAFDRGNYIPEIEKESFRREVAALTELKHPNIVKIIASSIGTEQMPAYIGLEWMENDLISEREQKSNELFKDWNSFIEGVGIPLAEALSFAHQRDCVHRDIKPANILRNTSQTLKLADFGVSKLRRDLQSRSTLKDFASRPFTPPETDTGINLFSRDVFGFGAICVWALSNKSISEYKELWDYSDKLDISNEARDWLQSCININPKKRPANGQIMLHQLVAINSTTAAGNKAIKIKQINLDITEQARERLALLRGTPVNQIAEMNHYINIDLRDSPSLTSDKTGGAQSAKRFNLYGGEVLYHIAPGINKPGMTIVGVDIHDASKHIKRKNEALKCDIRFQTGNSPGALSTDQAIIALTTAVNPTENIDEPAINLLVKGWQNTLDALEAYAKEAVPPIRYYKAERNGSTVTLYTEESLENVTLDQTWVINLNENIMIFGEVIEIKYNNFTLHVQRKYKVNIPDAGLATLDLSADIKGWGRQRTALESIIKRTTVRANIGDLIFQPKLLAAPINAECGTEESNSLDYSQFKAFTAAIGTSDFLLVQGPPGTGKTRLISKLITEEVKRNPNIRILLTSQTNVAIDNALEKVHLEEPQIRLLRVSRPDSPRVSDYSKRFLIGSLLKNWETEIKNLTDDAFKKWAKINEINLNKIVICVKLQLILFLRTESTKIRNELKDLQTERDSSNSTGVNEKNKITETDFTFARLENECRDKLDSNLNQIETQYELLERALGEAGKKIRKASDLDIEQIINNNFEAGDKRSQAEAKVKLLTEWQQRFGRDDSFEELLCADVSVVAATCLGLSQIDKELKLKFDLCIMDEAGKANSTEALVPLCRAHRWVMVGDPKQLPPFEHEALKDASYKKRFSINEESLEPLFDRLWLRAPEANKVVLKKQYRMVAPIGSLVSECFYDGVLENSERPIDETLQSVLGHSVIWLSTNELPDRNEVMARKSLINTCEIEKIFEVLELFQRTLSGSTKIVNVLCISGYAAQVSAIDQRLTRGQYKNFPNLNLEVNTIDSVQGREADVVIFSVVRSNPKGNAGFLKEFRRVNVALSRAREVLIIIGDHSFVETATSLDTLQKVLYYIKNKHKGVGLVSFLKSGGIQK